MRSRCFLISGLVLVCCSALPVGVQADDTIKDYWGTLLDPNSGSIAREIQLTQNVFCIATWRTPEFYITRKVLEWLPEKLSSQEVNKALTEFFETEVPKDVIVIVVVYRWFPNGPEYTLPPDMASGAVLSNDRGIRVQGELQEELTRDLRLRANGGEVRSMILGFKREVPQGNRGAKVNVLENTKSITMELPRVKKAGKPVSFTWEVPPKYPVRPFEMALLVDFRPEKYRIIW